MEVLFTKQFVKDLRGVKNKTLAQNLEDAITSVKQAISLADINNLKKLKGASNAYRIRIGDYRIGLYISGNTVEFCRFLNRSDLYKYFP